MVLLISNDLFNCFSGCFVADMLTSEQNLRKDIQNFEPIIRNLGVHMNWFLKEFSTANLIQFKNSNLESSEVKVKIFTNYK